MGKKWYASKTVWLNLIMLGGVFLHDQFGLDITEEEQGAVIAIVNLILRAITKEPLQP
ncbi:MAG: hypothetical protein A4E53_01271 [Pelotomaculum sp. PtaB.Bin104]|nr:MAG: hypothetical protein A4E53_01271 [Pelotomaculum sp. PtaB.Bin104]